MGAIPLRFPGPKNFAPALAIVAKATVLFSGLNTRWAVRYDLAATPRRPPRTERPRKGPAPSQPTNAEVALYLAAGGRDFFAVNDQTEHAIWQEIVTEAVVAVRAGGSLPTPQTMMLRYGNKKRALVLQRFAAGGGDLHIKPLDPGYVAIKIRLGYPARPGTKTGQLAAAIKSARVVAVRIG